MGKHPLVRTVYKSGFARSIVKYNVHRQFNETGTGNLSQICSLAEERVFPVVLKPFSLAA
jgi:hypothetical protein